MIEDLKKQKNFQFQVSFSKMDDIDHNAQIDIQQLGPPLFFVNGWRMKKDFVQHAFQLVGIRLKIDCHVDSFQFPISSFLF